MLERCKRGEHQFIKMQSTLVGPGEERVIRWCQCCGAIVIDLDVDGRTYPGYFQECRIPGLLREIKASSYDSDKDHFTTDIFGELFGHLYGAKKENTDD